MSTLPQNIAQIVEAASKGGRAFHQALFEVFPNNTIGEAIDHSLAICVECDHMDGIQAIRPHARRDTLQQAFVWACRRGRVDMMEILLPEQGVDQDRNRALTAAVESRSLAAVQWVIERTQKTSTDLPLMRAMEYDRVDIMKCIIDFFDHPHVDNVLHSCCIHEEHFSLDKVGLLAQHLPAHMGGSALRALLGDRNKLDISEDERHKAVHLLLNRFERPFCDHQIYTLAGAAHNAIVNGHNKILQQILQISTHDEIMSDDFELMRTAVQHNNIEAIEHIFELMDDREVHRLLALANKSNTFAGVTLLRQLQQSREDKTALVEAINTPNPDGRMGRKM